MEDDLYRLYELGQRLAARTLDEVSPGDEVRVTVNLLGAVVDVWVRPQAVGDLGVVRLGELITETAQEAQRRAERTYREAMAVTMPEDAARWTITASE